MLKFNYPDSFLLISFQTLIIPSQTSALIGLIHDDLSMTAPKLWLRFMNVTMFGNNDPMKWPDFKDLTSNMTRFKEVYGRGKKLSK